MFKRELRVGTKKGGKIGSGEGGGEIVILSTSTSTQIPNYKTSPPPEKKYKANNIVDKLLDRGS